MRRVLLLLILPVLLAVLPALGQSTEEQYVSIYNLIQEADRLAPSNPGAALVKYREAEAALLQFQKAFGAWNEPIVKFRLNYLNRRIAELRTGGTAAQVAVPAQPDAKPSTPAASTNPPAQPDPEVAALRERMQALQAENASLTAKLREALAARPASVDPMEITRAREKLRQLQKENDLLQVGLAKARTTPSEQPDLLQQTQLALNEARARTALREQELANVRSEKQQLEVKLQSLIPGKWNEQAMEKTRRELEEANERIAVITRERDVLRSSSGTNDVSILRQENELLKQQLARQSTQALPAAKSKAELELAALRSEMEILQRERAALQARITQLTTPGQPPSIPPAEAEKPEDPRQIAKIQRERDRLAKELELARTKLASRKAPVNQVQLEEFSRETLELKARLQAYETRAVAFSSEELAMFRQPEAPLTNAVSSGTRDWPPGSTRLREEAQKHLAEGKLDLAEKTYRELLRLEPMNVETLTRLAALLLQLDRGRDAEQMARKALAQAPQSAEVLSLLGQIHFHEKRYEEALKYLSRAAQLEPQNPEILNHLGLALSAKGLRGPAETTLRQALQLRPGYGLAHHNLAVLYISQTPPMIELARYHYARALSAGVASNPGIEKLLGNVVHIGPIE